MKYEYGVEYQLNHTKPNLPEGTLLEITFNDGAFKYKARLDKTTFDFRPMYDPRPTSFKIIDECYKPVSVSSENNQNTENVSDWWDYSKQEAIALPPVGEKVEVFLHWSGKWSGWVLVIGHDNDGVVWRNGSDSKSYIHTPRDEIRPLDWNRKAEEDKKRVVDAAAESVLTDAGLYVALEELYDLGFLRLPEDKK